MSPCIPNPAATSAKRRSAPCSVSRSSTRLSWKKSTSRTTPTLLAEYGEQIPVVTLNGTFLFEYAVDESRLRQLLKEVN